MKNQSQFLKPYYSHNEHHDPGINKTSKRGKEYSCKKQNENNHDQKNYNQQAHE